ncbi:MAG: carboxymuconolactone decarboxylase family protein [Desulfosporosinus sp.]|nr:carboxymuconolactone decarboxylase family protein [Desulfosporosinus sp.]
MSKGPRELMNNFLNGMQELGKTNEVQVGAFMNLSSKLFEPGVLDLKTKVLISVGIAVYNRCEYCIPFHTFKALEAGATREEIIEAAMVSVGLGGGPSMAYIATLLKDSLDEFEGDFK